MTTVVNLHRNQCDEYIGRPSILGNPFRIGKDGSRSEVIVKHMEWARDRIKRDPAYKAKVKSLYGKRLGCYCHPLPCHGDNYVVLAAELNNER